MTAVNVQLRSNTATLLCALRTDITQTVEVSYMPQGANASPQVYLGPNASVTSSNGVPMGPGSKVLLTRIFGDSLYAIPVSFDAVVQVNVVAV